MSCNVVGLLMFQICVILSIREMRKMMKDYYTPPQTVFQKLSAGVLDPSLFLAENSFLRWKYLPLEAWVKMSSFSKLKVSILKAIVAIAQLSNQVTVPHWFQMFQVEAW